MKRAWWLLAGAGLLALTGCSSGASADTVDAVLSEWSVTPTPTKVSAGNVTFNAHNEGGENHELVIVRADSPDSLPVDENGKVIEDELSESNLIGEIEEFEAGTTESASFDLTAGTYVIFCNIAEDQSDGSVESHFEEGMHAVITVES